MKKIVKRIIHKMGFELHRLNANTNPYFQLLKGLDKFDIDLVLDVGANTGQFASELRSIGYRGDIVSFEPLSKEHDLLSMHASKDPRWKVHERSAIGDFDGEVEINISGNSVSSSIMPMLKSHSSVAVDSLYVDVEKAPISCLDSASSIYIKESKNIFIKIDTQGYEWQVLNGASELIKNTKGILCELSLVPLYEGQKLWKELIERLESEGFTLWYIQSGFTDPINGRALQVDAAFFRTSDV